MTYPALPEDVVTTNQIPIGVGLILAPAIGSQVLASRLRMPAPIVLRPVGLAASVLTTVVNQAIILTHWPRVSTGRGISMTPVQRGSPIRGGKYTWPPDRRWATLHRVGEA